MKRGKRAVVGLLLLAAGCGSEPGEEQTSQETVELEQAANEPTSDRFANAELPTGIEFRADKGTEGSIFVDRSGCERALGTYGSRGYVVCNGSIYSISLAESAVEWQAPFPYEGASVSVYSESSIFVTYMEQVPAEGLSLPENRFWAAVIDKADGSVVTEIQLTGETSPLGIPADDQSDISAVHFATSTGGERAFYNIVISSLGNADPSWTGVVEVTREGAVRYVSNDLLLVGQRFGDFGGLTSPPNSALRVLDLDNGNVVADQPTGLPALLSGEAFQEPHGCEGTVGLLRTASESDPAVGFDTSTNEFQVYDFVGSDVFATSFGLLEFGGSVRLHSYDGDEVWSIPGENLADSGRTWWFGGGHLFLLNRSQVPVEVDVVTGNVIAERPDFEPNLLSTHRAHDGWHLEEYTSGSWGFESRLNRQCG